MIIENVGGAGGSIAVGRVARAQPDGYTIDIGQWDTHVGSIIYKLNYDLQKDFDPIGLISVNPQLMVAKKNLPANDLKGLVAWMKANPGKITFVNQNAAAQVTGLLFEQATGQKVQFIPYRGAGPAMTDLHLRAGRSAGGAGGCRAAAGPGRHRQGDRQPLAAAFGRDAGHPDLGRKRRARALYVGLVRLLRAAGPAEGRARASSTAPWSQALADPAVRKRFAELGLDVASKEQQTPAGLAAFQEAEIKKWWPIIKAANIKGE